MLNALVTLAAEPAGEAHNRCFLRSTTSSGRRCVCFVVIIFVVWRVALPRMAKLLDERSAAIEGNIAKADEAQRQAEAALEQYTAQLAEARREAGEIRESATQDGRKIVAEARETAAADAARITASAHARSRPSVRHPRAAALRGRYPRGRPRRQCDR